LSLRRHAQRFCKKKLYDAVGCVSRTMITPYPPGIPVVCPGEVINGDIVEYIVKIIEAGGVVTVCLQTLKLT